MLFPQLQNKKIWILVGTRPEVIKQAPLYFACCEKFGKDAVALLGTGQHRELLEQALAHFNLKLDYNMSIMKPGQTLTGSSAAVLEGMQQLLNEHKPEWIIVQGDTTTAAMAAWAGFQNDVKIAHNEAGLRSYDLRHPFPEEANRKLIGVVADVHFPPTKKAETALLAENTDKKKIFVTGNTGIDALRITLEMPEPQSVTALVQSITSKGLRPVLLTAHRRENQGEAIDQWFSALASFIDAHKDISLIYPMHPNNAGREAATKYLAAHERIHLMPAINYGETCHILKHARFVITDSGGIQEEASTLGMPVVVCRKTTERMEAVEAGVARLAGTSLSTILESMQWAYDRSANGNERTKRDIFGDGFSSKRIAEILSSL